MDEELFLEGTMNLSVPNDVFQDGMAVFFARLIAAANREARPQGVDTGNSLTMISQIEGRLT